MQHEEEEQEEIDKADVDLPEKKDDENHGEDGEDPPQGGDEKRKRSA